jgi:methionyl-tRNA synthetase
MPWVLAKGEENQKRLATVLYNLTESICIGASLLEAFMPETATKILKQLNTKVRPFKEMDILENILPETKSRKNQKFYLQGWISKRFFKK